MKLPKKKIAIVLISIFLHGEKIAPPYVTLYLVENLSKWSVKDVSTLVDILYNFNREWCLVTGDPH